MGHMLSCLSSRGGMINLCHVYCKCKCKFYFQPKHSFAVFLPEDLSFERVWLTLSFSLVKWNSFRELPELNWKGSRKPALKLFLSVEEKSSFLSPSRTITQSAEQFAAREKLLVFAFLDRILLVYLGASRWKKRENWGCRCWYTIWRDWDSSVDGSLSEYNAFFSCCLLSCYIKSSSRITFDTLVLQVMVSCVGKVFYDCGFHKQIQIIIT